VIAVLLVVVGLVGPTTTNSTAVTKLRHPQHNQINSNSYTIATDNNVV
jgi:hypothetical protein